MYERWESKAESPPPRLFYQVPPYELSSPSLKLKNLNDSHLILLHCRSYYYIAKLRSTHSTCMYRNYRPELKLFEIATKNNNDKNNAS